MSAVRERATRVYGDSRAAWYLDGQYYDHHWNPISHEEAALPALDSEAPPAPAPEPEPELPSYTVVYATPPIAEAPIEEPPVERASEVDATYGNDRLLRLKKVKPLTLQRMVMKAGGTPATGQGAKNKNIAWLLEHVKD